MSKKIIELGKKSLKAANEEEEKKVRSIRRFLKNQMSDPEQSQFQHKMDNNRDLRNEVDVYRIIMEELKSIHHKGED